MSERIPVAYSSLPQYPFRIAFESFSEWLEVETEGEPVAGLDQKILLTYHCPSSHYPNIPDNTELLHAVQGCVRRGEIEARFLFSCDNKEKLSGCADFVAQQAGELKNLGVRVYPSYPPDSAPSAIPFDIAVAIFVARKTRDLRKTFVLWILLSLSVLGGSFLISLFSSPKILPNTDVWISNVFMEICILSFLNVLIYGLIFGCLLRKLKPQLPRVFPELETKSSTSPGILLIRGKSHSGKMIKQKRGAGRYMKRGWEEWFQSEIVGRLLIYKKWSLLASAVEAVENELIYLSSKGWKQDRKIIQYLPYALKALVESQAAKFIPPGFSGQIALLFEEMPIEAGRSPNEKERLEITHALTNLLDFAEQLRAEDNIEQDVSTAFYLQAKDSLDRMTPYFQFNSEDVNWRREK